MYVTLRSSTCFEQHAALHLHTVRLFTEGDDTRGCSDTICPPEDEQRAARKHVEDRSVTYILLKNKGIVH